MKKTKPKRDTEAVRIKSEVVELVRANKGKEGVPVGKFFEIAALEKLVKK